MTDTDIQNAIDSYLNAKDKVSFVQGSLDAQKAVRDAAIVQINLLQTQLQTAKQILSDSKATLKTVLNA